MASTFRAPAANDSVLRRGDFIAPVFRVGGMANEWLLAGSGLASVIFGAIAAVFPGAGILAIIWLLGAWLIVLGVILIAFALSLRQLAHGHATAGVA